MSDIAAVSKVIIKKGPKVLFLKRTDDGEWELPGGHLEKGERHNIGAKREVKEETNILLTKLKVIFKEKDFILYAAKPKIAKIKLSIEHTDYRWATIPQIKRLKLSGPTKKNIRIILNTI